MANDYKDNFMPPEVINTDNERSITMEDVVRYTQATGDTDPSLKNVMLWMANDDEKYIGIKFGGTGKTYIYECPGCKVGDYVVVPRAGYGRYGDGPQVVRVVQLGRAGSDVRVCLPRIKPAQRVKNKIAKFR